MALRLSTLLTALLLVLLVGAGPAAARAASGKPSAAVCKDTDTVPTSGNASRVRAATLCLVNRERTKRGRVALKRNRTLERVATRYAGRMVEERFFAHVSPDGGTLTERIRSTSYLAGSLKRWSLGENLAWGTGRLGTPRSIVESWMQSSGHRHNILDRRFREAGFGVAAGVPDPDASGRAATYTNVFGQRVRR